MGVALIGWGRFSTPDGNVTVPCPSSKPPAPYLWDWLASQCHTLRRVGFTALQLPPSGKAQGGDGAGCDGYGVFDPMDQGAKNQQGSVNTRYGSFRSLRRLVAVAHANDMQVYHDVVLHQRIGGFPDASTFEYLGADGKTPNGRWPMRPGCFRGDVVEVDGKAVTIAEDDVPNAYWDISFGSEVSFQHCVPAGYTLRAAIGYVEWLFASTDADGARLDDVKGMWPEAVHRVSYIPALFDKVLYGEFFDNADNALGWANAAPMHGRVMVEDFQGKFNIQYACNGNDAWPMAGSSVATMAPALAVTFVDNPDTDTSAGEQTISNKRLAYVELLTNPGYPFVYSKDYFPGSVWPGAYGLQPTIDVLVGAHENLMFGDPEVLLQDGSCRVKMSHGYPGLLTGMNFDTWNRREVTVQTSFGPRVQLHDYSGHVPDIWTDADGRATFTIASDAYDEGESWVMFSRTGYWAEPTVPQRPTTQSFFGAADLDIGPAINGQISVGEVHCAQGTPIVVSGRLSTDGWTKASSVTVAMVGETASGATVELASVTHTLGGSEPWPKLEAPQTGFYALEVQGIGLPTQGSPFEFAVTYTAPQEVVL